MSSKAHAAFKRLDSGAAEAVGFAGHYRFFSTRDNYGGLQGSKLCDVKHIRNSCQVIRTFSLPLVPRSAPRSASSCLRLSCE